MQFPVASCWSCAGKLERPLPPPRPSSLKVKVLSLSGSLRRVGRTRPGPAVGGQAGSREMSVWRAKLRGTLAVTGGNEEGRMQNAEIRVEATPRPPSGHLVANR